MSHLPNQPLRGMVDEFPNLHRSTAWMKKQIDDIARRFCYEEYDLPVLEPLELYAQGDGATTDDIYHKQAYTFKDKGGRTLILRPEMTRSLARMASRVFRESTKPLRWYSVGKCYRYERPQKGRLREFKQLNVDSIGSNPFPEAEIVQFVIALMEAFGVQKNHYTIRYSDKRLVESLLQNEDFSWEEKNRFYKLIDNLNEVESGPVIIDLPKEDFPEERKRTFIRKFITATNVRPSPEQFCKEFNIKVHVKSLHEQMQLFDKTLVVFDPRIVRGLDYYTGFVFEVFANQGGIKRSLFGGGSYKNLIKPFAPFDAEGIGFGMGIDIVKLFLEGLGQLPKESQWNESCYVLGTGGDAGVLLQLADTLRKESKAVEVGRTTSGQFQSAAKEAERKRHRYLVFLGEDELKANQVVARDLKKRQNTNDIYRLEGGEWKRAENNPRL